MGERAPLRWMGWLCIALAVAPGFAQAQQPAPADASAAQEARERFRRGVELFEDGDPAGALLEFRRAYSIEPRYQVLYNIAKVEAVLRKYAAALGSFEEYLEQGGTRIDPKRRAEVEAEIAKLKTRVGMLEIASTPSGASVIVDDSPVGTTPLSVRVRVGVHNVRVSKPGFGPLTLNVEVASLERKEVKFDLNAVAPEPVDPPVAKVQAPAPPIKKAKPEPPQTTKPVEEGGLSVGAMAAWIGTGVLFTGTVISGALALSAKSERDNEIDSLGTSADDIESANDRARTLAIVTDVLGLSTVALASLSVYLTVSSDAGGRTTGLRISPAEVRWQATF